MSPSIESGSLISRYRVVSRLGAGGMGEVYEAHDPSLDRSIALKVLPPDMVKDEDRVERFILEAKSASGLSHPHIITIHEIGESSVTDVKSGSEGDSRIHYIAMELIDGSTLRSKIHHEKSDLRDLVRWLSQVAEGLSKAHAAGIIHRDLKPDNIMITRDGYAKVLDFGLAKLTERATEDSAERTAVRDRTGEGVVLGSVNYMSPEQVQAKKLDSRTDIFSFGCILYEAATRRKPFEGDTGVDVMHQILHSRPEAIREIEPGVPGALRRMIRRCLEKDPDKRYQSMKDLAIELADLAEEWEDLDVSRSSLSSGPMPAMAGNRRWLIAAGIGSAAIIAMIAFVVNGKRGGSTTASPAPVATSVTYTQITTDSGEEMQPSISPDGTFVAYTSRIAGNWDIYLLRIGGRNPINLTAGSPMDDSSPAISPDGQTIAFRSERDGGGIFLMGSTGESVRRLTDSGYDPAWAPDGKRIVVSDEAVPNPYARQLVSALWIVDIGTGEKKKIFEGDAVQPNWSPDGSKIAFWGLPDVKSGRRDIGFVPATGGKAVWLTSDAALDWNPVWAADGKLIFFSSDRGGSLNLWRLAVDASGNAIGAPVALSTPSKWSAHISVARDGKRLIFVSRESRSNIERIDFDPATGKSKGAPVAVTRGSVPVSMFDISADRQWVTFRTEGQQEDIFVVRIDGTDLRQLTNDAAKDRGPRWSPDGKRIAFYSDRSGGYEIWTINLDGSGLQRVTETAGSRPYWFPVWSSDSTKMALSNEEHTVIIELTGGLPVRSFQEVPNPEGLRFGGFDFSPDGRELVGSMSGGAGNAGISIYTLADRSFRQLSPIESKGTFLLPRFLPDGGVVFADGDGVHLVDARSGVIRTIEIPDADQVSNAVPSSDGGMVLYRRVILEADLWMATLE